MSHANGAVRFEDGKIMFFEYNGTTDICISHLYDTHKEMHDNWRKQEWLDCACGKDEPVEIVVDYGYGSHWQARACRHCKAITDGLEPPMDLDEWLDGHPNWSPLKDE